MDTQVKLLAIIAVLNILFSVVLIRDNRGLLRVLFSLVVLFSGLWSLSLGLFINTTNLDTALWASIFYYLFAAAIPLLFFYFSVVFVNNKSALSLRYLAYLLPFFYFSVSFLLDNNFIIKNIHYIEGTAIKDVVLNRQHYIYYSVYFLFYVLTSYIVLLRAIISKDLGQGQKKQLNIIIIGTATSYLLAIVPNLLLPYLGNYQLIWLGPLFTILLVSSIAYAILKHHLFSIKLIATELLIFGVWIAIIFMTTMMDTINGRILGGVVLVVVVVTGIFLIKGVKRIDKLAEDLGISNEKLGAANNELEQLAGRLKSVNRIMSHDIKNVLGKNKDMFGMLLDGSFKENPERAKPFLEQSYSDTQKLIRSVIVILESGQELILKPAPFDLKEAVLEVVHDEESDAKAKGLAIATAIDEKETYTIVADRTQLVTHVLRNLIENAIHYTLAGTITVGLSKKDANNALFSVKDTGIGIPDEDKPNIFKEGGHGKDSIKVNVHSTGYGLYSVKRIVDAHCGKVWFETEAGKGTVFFVEIPISG